MFEFSKTLGNTVYTKRKKMKLTQAELAEMAGVTEQTICKIEHHGGQSATGCSCTDYPGTAQYPHGYFEGSKPYFVGNYFRQLPDYQKAKPPVVLFWHRWTLRCRFQYNRDAFDSLTSKVFNRFLLTLYHLYDIICKSVCDRFVHPPDGVCVRRMLF